MIAGVKSRPSTPIKVGKMPLVTWVAIGTAMMLALSALVGFAVAAILGRISREVSELLEVERWPIGPPPRAKALARRA
jgi:hypothetical protein